MEMDLSMDMLVAASLWRKTSWSTVYFEYYYPGRDFSTFADEVDTDVFLVVKRICRLLAGRDEDDIQALIGIVDLIVEDHFSIRRSGECVIVEYVEAVNRGERHELLTVWEKMFEENGIDQKIMNEVMRDPPKLTSKKYEEFYDKEVALCLELMEEYDLEKVLDDVGIEWHEVFALLAANALGRLIFESKKDRMFIENLLVDNTIKKNSDLFYLCSLGTGGVRVKKDPDNNIIDVGVDMKSFVVGHAPKAKALEHVSVIKDLLGIAEQLKGDLICINSSSSRAIKNILSVNNRLAIDKRHAPARKIKNQFVKYYYENFSHQKMKRKDVALAFYQALSVKDKRVLTPSSREENAIRTLCDALRDYEKSRG